MKISDSVRYAGVNDHKVDLFEGQYDVPNGMAYNSYVIMDEKTVVMDTVDRNFKDEWLQNVEEALGGRKPDYLVVSHMEPDHSANIAAFVSKYPEATVVGNAQTFNMMGQFFDLPSDLKKLIVKNNDTLEIGKNTLTFVFAPMVHWPEVMVSYMTPENVLFSADAFGKFGALDVEEDWACEARRYYFGIVGKYGVQAQNLLKAASGLKIDVICPLHGPILTENLPYYLDLYDKWSSYTPEDPGIFIAYASVYGHTREAAEHLKELLEKKGAPKVSITDLARDDMAEAVEDAFRYDRLVLATPTYNGDVFPFMRTFIDALLERNYQKRKIGIIENGTWAPMAAKVIKGMFEKSKDITFVEPVVTVKSALKDDSRAKLEELAEAMK
ncbi:MAG: FprA family A-type flavoprotein [Lachnospiraceae bacterium]|nr:FprA family A-type flavoprotein [Lachnospiraceae bacterium]